jgi:hypothetical protein
MGAYVFLDESGQTYYNYLDPQQGYFAYGSLRCSEIDCRTIKTSYFAAVKSKELHYVDLRKAGNGQAAVKSFLRDNRVWIEQNFKWFFIDKRYALLAKYVDLLIEPEVASLGENLYSGGGAQTLVFLLHHFAKLTGNEDSLSSLMTAFSGFARKPTEESLATLERAASDTTVGKPELDSLLTMPFIRRGTSLLRTANPANLDLSFTAAFGLVQFWFQELGEPFWVIHDESKALSSQIDAWRNLTQENLGYQTSNMGSHEVATNVPLRETLFVSSEASVALQIVDVVLGAHRSLFEWFLRGRPADLFLSEVEALMPIPYPTLSVMPMNDPSGIPTTDQTVDELDRTLRDIGRRI